MKIPKRSENDHPHYPISLSDLAVRRYRVNASTSVSWILESCTKYYLANHCWARLRFGRYAWDGTSDEDVFGDGVHRGMVAIGDVRWLHSPKEGEVRSFMCWPEEIGMLGSSMKREKKAAARLVL